jgi:hypothetical protein
MPDITLPCASKYKFNDVQVPRYYSKSIFCRNEKVLQRFLVPSVGSISKTTRPLSALFAPFQSGKSGKSEKG